LSCHSDRAYREGYLNLLCIEPKISDLVTERPLTELTFQLDKGRNEFRNSQVHSIRDLISGWGFGIPDDGQLRGFGDDICGRLLCPSTRDWDDPTCVFNDLPPVPSGNLGTDIMLRRTREQIRSFQIPVTADDFPKFLWEGERVTLQDMKKGFLRGELLVKVRLFFHLGLAHSDTHYAGTSRYANRAHRYTPRQSKHWCRGVR